jgi:hypothetical protein
VKPFLFKRLSNRAHAARKKKHPPQHLRNALYAKERITLLEFDNLLPGRRWIPARHRLPRTLLKTRIPIALILPDPLVQRGPRHLRLLADQRPRNVLFKAKPDCPNLELKPVAIRLLGRLPRPRTTTNSFQSFHE